MEPQTTILPAGLNVLDCIVLATLLLSGIFAMFRGFVRESFSLVSWSIAYFVAAKYHQLVEPFIHHYVRNEQATMLLASAGLFVIILVALTVIGNAIADGIHGKGLTAIDRSLGFIFGLARGVLIVCIVYMAAISIWWPDMNKPQAEQQKDAEQKKEKNEPPAWLMDAKTRPGMARGAELLKKFIPEDDIKRTMDVFDEKKMESQRAADQEALDKMSTPTVTTKEPIPSSYGTEIRQKIDNLINEKSKP